MLAVDSKNVDLGVAAMRCLRYVYPTISEVEHNVGGQPSRLKSSMFMSRVYIWCFLKALRFSNFPKMQVGRVVAYIINDLMWDSSIYYFIQHPYSKWNDPLGFFWILAFWVKLLEFNFFIGFSGQVTNVSWCRAALHCLSSNNLSSSYSNSKWSDPASCQHENPTF